MGDIRRTIFDLTKNVTKVSNKLLKQTKLNIALASEEDRLRSTYIDIGKKVHEIYAYGGNLGTFFDGKYAELQEIEMKIKDLRNQIDVVSDTKTCASCGKAVDRIAEYCPKCGKKMDGTVLELQEAEVPERIEIDPSQAPSPVMVLCSRCGSKNDEGTKYCLSCGSLL